MLNEQPRPNANAPSTAETPMTSKTPATEATPAPGVGHSSESTPEPEVSEPSPIPWNHTEEAAQEKAAARRWPVMAYFGCAPECGDSLALESVTFADQRVIEFIEAHVVPLKLDRQAQARLAERYNAAQTPVVLLTDSNGHVFSRIDGFLPPDEFLARLSVGVGAVECGLAETPPAETHVDAAPAPAPAWASAPGGGSEVAAQALYWQAAARFRRTGDTRRLRADWQAIASRFPNSVWALRTRVGGAARRAS